MKNNTKYPVTITSGLMEFPQRSSDITFKDAVVAKKGNPRALGCALVVKNDGDSLKSV